MSKRIQKIDQLDSLRALAAFCVILHHFLPEYNIGTFSFGWIGVDVFFVVSGYLITAILLEQKAVITDKILIIKNFVIKRALRLFPVYYLFITFFLILMCTIGLYVWDQGDGIYFYTYTQNILFFREGMKGIQINHLWTLAVEEQFYLFWPWVLIYISNNRLIRILMIIIPLTMLFKSFFDMDDSRMLTLAHFDTLGSGALMALLIKENREQLLLFLNKIKILTIIIPLLILIVGTGYELPYFITVLAVLILSTSMVNGCHYNFTGIFGRVLDLTFLKYLGKISYGLYLYHKPIPYFVKLVAGKSHIYINNIVLFLLSIILTISISHLSFLILEKRFLKLKNKFDL